MTTFNTGDTVLRYSDHHDKAPTTEKVKAVTKRTVTLVTGEKFTSDGDAWGMSSRWFRAHIEKVATR